MRCPVILDTKYKYEILITRREDSTPAGWWAGRQRASAGARDPRQPSSAQGRKPSELCRSTMRSIDEATLVCGARVITSTCAVRVHLQIAEAQLPHASHSEETLAANSSPPRQSQVLGKIHRRGAVR